MIIESGPRPCSPYICIGATLHQKLLCSVHLALCSNIPKVAELGGGQLQMLKGGSVSGMVLLKSAV